jgi:HPt (histidine-containing phosphotransfer) domain-containing protein
LRQLGNNVKLYTKLLDQFQKSYGSAATDIAANIKADDYETAKRSAHTIKGLAGSLGATALQEISAKLEKLYRERAESADIEETLGFFGDELDAAIAGIRTYLEASAAPAPVSAAPAVNHTQLAAQLMTLSAHIDDSDARALMLFDEMKSQLTAYDPNAANCIAAAFEIFDFPTAADVVAELRARLG